MEGSNLPTPLGEGASQLHELFMTYVDAGFTEDQALRLLAYMIAFSHEKDSNGE